MDEKIGIYLYSVPETPLHWATLKGDLECVNILIQNGADLEAKNVGIEERVYFGREIMRFFGEFSDKLFFECGGVVSNAG